MYQFILGVLEDFRPGDIHPDCEMVEKTTNSSSLVDSIYLNPSNAAATFV